MSIFLNIDMSKIKRLNEFEDEDGNNTTDEVEDDQYKEGDDPDETTDTEDTGTTDTDEDQDAGGEGETDETETGEEGNDNPEGEEDLRAEGDNDDIVDGGYDGEDDADGEDTGGEGGDDDEYRIDDTGDDKGGDDTTGGEDDAEDDTTTDDTENDSESKLKQLEGEIFDQLSDSEKKIKITELKKNFEAMYNRCDGIIKMVNNVTAPDENSSKILEYLNDNLTDLKQYIYDYFTYTFDTKSYLENSAQYQKYIALLNSLNNVLESLAKKNKKEE